MKRVSVVESVPEFFLLTLGKILLKGMGKSKVKDECALYQQNLPNILTTSKLLNNPKDWSA